MALRNCPACGFAGLPGEPPTSVEHHKAHRLQHLRAFPDSDEKTRAALDQMVRFAELGKFNAPSPEAA